MNCERCGWTGGEPHPPACPSKYRVGEQVYVIADPDQAPILANFVRLHQLEPYVTVLIEVNGRGWEVSYASLASVEKWPVLT